MKNSKERQNYSLERFFGTGFMIDIDTHSAQKQKRKSIRVENKFAPQKIFKNGFLHPNRNIESIKSHTFES